MGLLDHGRQLRILPPLDSPPVLQRTVVEEQGREPPFPSLCSTFTVTEVVGTLGSMVLLSLALISSKPLGTLASWLTFSIRWEYNAHLGWLLSEVVW